MSIELKPCPFCGGEAEALSWTALSPTIHGVTSVACTECAAGIEVDTAELWLHDAAWYWNSRAERTCYNTWLVELTGRLRFQCSECKAVSLEIAPLYCPVCGAKVVEE